MPLPRLIHPVDIVVEQIDRSQTYYDDEAREPVQQIERSAQVTLPGQVKWEEQFGLEQKKSGVRETSRGYVLFRKADLDGQSVVLQLNDRIVKMGHVETDVYLDSLEWLGHYQDQSGPSLQKAFFTDRRPSRQERGG